MLVLRAFKTELDPNDRQRTALLRHAGAARFAFNWGLARRIEERKAGRKAPNAISLHRELNALKPAAFPWMYEVSKCAPQEAFRNLDWAFDNFFRKCKLKKQGKFKGKAGFPRFKTKRKGPGSFRLTGFIHINDKSVQLPRLGELRLKERSYIPTSGVKVLSATVSEHAGRWFVSVQVEQDMPQKAWPKDEHSVIGIDLGIKILAVCSDGQAFENPKALGRNLKKLRRLQRAVSRKQKGGRNRRKAAGKVARLHYRIGCIRKDALNKVTTSLTRTKSTIVIEDLNVSGMMRNRCLSRAISDLGLFEFRRQLEYKGKWNGCEIVVADRFFASSKTCSTCGFINKDLTLADRSWHCPACGTTHDRDFNASVNLEKWVAGSSMETKNACEGRGPLVLARA